MKRSWFGLAQAAVCGVAIGLTLFVCSWLWRPGSAHAAGSVADVVRAREFQVVDKGGKVRGSLALSADGSSGLRLLDAAGKPRTSLGVAADGSQSLVLCDAGKKTRAGLGVAADGSPSLRLYDAAEKTRASLLVLPDGRPGLSLWDAAGKPVWSAP